MMVIIGLINIVGYIIKSIDLDTEEGFTEEGYKLKTRDILEKELADAVLLGGPSLKKTDSPREKTYYKYC